MECPGTLPGQVPGRLPELEVRSGSCCKLHISIHKTCAQTVCCDASAGFSGLFIDRLVETKGVSAASHDYSFSLESDLEPKLDYLDTEKVKHHGEHIYIINHCDKLLGIHNVHTSKAPGRGRARKLRRFLSHWAPLCRCACRRDNVTYERLCQYVSR